MTELSGCDRVCMTHKAWNTLYRESLPTVEIGNGLWLPIRELSYSNLPLKFCLQGSLLMFHIQLLEPWWT